MSKFNLFNLRFYPQQKLNIKYRYLVRALLPRSNEKKAKILNKFIPKKHKIFTSSGRQGISLILEAIKKQKILESTRKRENTKLKVAISAFTCQVVKEAAEDSNCEISYYDSFINTSYTDLEEFIKKQKKAKNLPDVLILSYNLGFMPENVKDIINLCKKHDIIVVEDCAQALYARQKFQNKIIIAGELGDFAVYSFGISKNIGFTGGMVTTDDNNYSKLILEEINQLQKINLVWQLLIISKIKLAPLLLSPIIYRFTRFFVSHKVDSIKKERYPKLNYKIPKYFKNIIISYLANYQKVLKQRQDNYKEITREKTLSSALYLPIICRSRKDKLDKIRFAKKQGLEINTMQSFYYLPINYLDNSYENIAIRDVLQKEFPKAAGISKHLLTIALLGDKKRIKKIKKTIDLLNQEA